jgi:mono/diheme cytochrome c family protein
MKKQINTIIKNAWMFAAAIIISLFSSCYYSNSSPGWEYMPDMAHSVAYETYSSNPFFPDSMNAIQPVPHTIPRGVYMPFHYSPQQTGYDSAGVNLIFPTWLNDEEREQGKYIYEIYCSVCHGKGGTGNGSIVENPKIKNPFPPPPSYFSENLINLPAGKMYYSVYYGKNLMGPYGKILNNNEIWKVVYYVKSLQQHHADSTATAGTAIASADTAVKSTANNGGNANAASGDTASKK